ncbi:MAG TPA: mechanosensitive ion channel protein MscS [Gammaproteobacteria bacterium]|nr:mechanosensitive ion channel protein MscS [Gammaproteobacteria bacterium]
MIRKTLTALAFIISAILVQPVMAGGSVQHSGNSITHSAQAIGNAGQAGFKLSAGVVAVPLAIVGGVGTASAAASEDLWEIAHADGEVALPVTDEIVTAGPNPAAAMQQGAAQ